MKRSGWHRESRRHSLAARGITTGKLVELGKGTCQRTDFLNCRLFVQLTSGESDIENLPIVSYDDMEIGDIITWGEDPIRHLAFNLGNTRVLEVEEWGKYMGISSLADVNAEYPTEPVVYRPDWSKQGVLG